MRGNFLHNLFYSKLIWSTIILSSSHVISFENPLHRLLKKVLIVTGSAIMAIYDIDEDLYKKRLKFMEFSLIFGEYRAISQVPLSFIDSWRKLSLKDLLNIKILYDSEYI